MNNIYRVIYENDKISKQEIADILGLSLPTVAHLVTQLIKKGVVFENGYFNSTGGRKAMAISCKMDAKTAIGIDITQNHICCVLVDLSGKILYSARIRLSYEGDRPYYEKLLETIEKMLLETGTDPKTVLGIGVSVPGIVLHNKEITYDPLLKNHDLYENLKEYISYPYMIINDANAGGFGEAWYAHYTDNVFYLSLSNSVGGALIMNNHVCQGKQGICGEIGHTTLVIDGKPCYCGKKGCVDAYCSDLKLSNLTDGNLKQFFDLVETGDKASQAVWSQYLRDLSVVINNLYSILDCDIIVGGYVGSYIEKYLEELRKLTMERCTFRTDGSYLKSCVLKLESSAVGAALHYIDAFIKSI